MKNKKIVIINQDSGYLMIDIAHAFLDAGYDCTLMSGRLVERDIKLDNRVGRQQIISYNRKSAIKRILTWLWGTVQILFFVWTKHSGARLLIVSNPPFSFFTTLFFRNRYSLLVYDIYPDALYQMGILSRGSVLVRIWENLNRRIFAKASHIYTLTPGMKQRLSEFVSGEKIEVVPVWSDNTFLKPVAKNLNPFVAEQGLKDKFVIIYSGNLGKTHPVESIVDLALLFRDNPAFFFLIIGEGNKKEQIAQRIASCGLTNCRLLPYQPAEVLPFTLSSGDLAIITLDEKASHLSIPSKTYNFLSVGAPLLGIAAPESELAKLIERYSVGQCFRASELAEMQQYILQLSENKLAHKSFSDNSLNTSLLFTKKNAMAFLGE